MTNHWNQNRSNFRTGEPKDHLEAKEFIGTLLKWEGWSVHYEYPLVDPLVEKYTHKYDIVAFKRVMVIEIDDPALHSKPRKITNDKIARAYYDQHFPMQHFLRLNKDEINSGADTMQEYLATEFWPHLK